MAVKGPFGGAGIVSFGSATMCRPGHTTEADGAAGGQGRPLAPQRRSLGVALLPLSGCRRGRVLSGGLLFAVL